MFQFALWSVVIVASIFGGFIGGFIMGLTLDTGTITLFEIKNGDIEVFKIDKPQYRG